MTWRHSMYRDSVWMISAAHTQLSEEGVTFNRRCKHPFEQFTLLACALHCARKVCRSLSSQQLAKAIVARCFQPVGPAPAIKRCKIKFNQTTYSLNCCTTSSFSCSSHHHEEVSACAPACPSWTGSTLSQTRQPAPATSIGGTSRRALAAAEGAPAPLCASNLKPARGQLSAGR